MKASLPRPSISTRDWKIRITDILAAIDRIQEYTQGMTYQAWCCDSKTIDAVIRNFEVIGEAASQVPLATQECHPDIPWHQLRGIRNILIHEYFGVDEDILWKTIQNDIDFLREKLRPLA